MAGCSELGPHRCELPDNRELTLWFSGAGPGLTMRAGAAELAGERKSIAGGVRVQVTIPASASTLSVEDHGRRWSVELSPARSPDPSFEAVIALRKQHKLAEARALLEPLSRDPDQVRRARAHGMLGRMLLGEQRWAEALVELRRALSEARSAGLLVAAGREARAIADTEYTNWNLAAARVALSEVSRADAEAQVDVQHYLAQFALVTGDLDSALRLSRALQLDAERVAVDGDPGAQIELQVLTELGRVHDARARVLELRQIVSNDPCREAVLSENEGWLELSAQGQIERAIRATEQAITLFRTQCNDPVGSEFDLSNSLINLALAHYRLGDLTHAKSELEEARRTADLTGWQQAWERDLDAAILLREGHAQEALERYRELVIRSEVAAPLASRYYALLGVARAMSALGKQKDAVAAYTSAEQVLDEDARRAPLGEGRETFTESRSDASSELVRLLVDMREPARALEVARHARVRGLLALVHGERSHQHTPEAQAAHEKVMATYLAARSELEELTSSAWAVPVSDVPALKQRSAAARTAMQIALEQVLGEAPSDARRQALPAAQSGELGLYLFPLGDQLFAFASSERQVTVQRLPLATLPGAAPELSRLLLDPLARRIAAAKLVRVVAYGPQRDWDVHAWPFADGALIDHLPVVYGTDLAGDRPAKQTYERALVVENPRGDLPYATREGKLVSGLLRQAGLQIDELAGRAASRAAVLHALPEADLFHYAGHAQLEGFAGWQSHLLLTARELLEVSDVLALERVPAFVVLSGCETGLESRDAAFSLGIAQAFIARGTEYVLATTRRVPDPLGETFAPLLYGLENRTFTPAGVTDSIRSLRIAKGAIEQWPAYRLYVR